MEPHPQKVSRDVELTLLCTAALIPSTAPAWLCSALEVEVSSAKSCLWSEKSSGFGRVTLGHREKACILANVRLQKAPVHSALGL